MNSYIYIRGLRRAEHTVFCVQEGQKTFYDTQFGVRCAYSSGQQVKRSILSTILDELQEQEAPVTFNYEISKDNSISNKEPWSPCNPAFTDQLLGGWMKAQPGEVPLKRRSPFSISAMRPLHPLLGGLELQKENITFDRSSNPARHPVIVKNSKGEIMADEDIREFLSTNKRSLPRRTWIPDNTRATGLFVFDLAIDLRTLFCVSVNEHEPEITSKQISELKNSGWTDGKNAFGNCLVYPKEKQGPVIAAIAKGIINWRITSNQSRTFSLMETLAFGISDNANLIAAAIRAELDEDKERAAKPVIDRSTGAELYVTLPCNGYICGAGGELNALEKAEESLIRKLSSFPYGS